MKKIALEEHFITEEFRSYMSTILHVPDYKETSALLDVGEGRLKEMDKNGIDMQVLSLVGPGVEPFDADDGTAMAKSVNDKLANVVKKHPKRFAGLATLAPQDPNAAVDELERAVKELGFKGAKINSNIRGEYLDDEKYWPIFEMAEKLDVPIYLHPKVPEYEVMKPYFKYPVLVGPSWGFAADTCLCAMGLICSGVFDK